MEKFSFIEDKLINVLVKIIFKKTNQKVVK